MNRYDRQICLPEIGVEGQAKLLNASVLCIGAGGLGSPALLYLAAAGIGHIGIMDDDRVEASNLQRQILFDTFSLGQSKAHQAAKRLQALNPTLKIEAYEEKLHAENAARLFPLYDLILDGTDNFETKFLINDAAVKFERPWVYGALQGFEGQVSVFNHQGGPCYRCLFPAKPKESILNCAEGGVMGVVAGLVGVTQALQVIQLIVNHESFEPLSGKVMTLNARTLQTRLLTLHRAADCPLCHLPKDAMRLNDSVPTCSYIPEVLPQQIKGRTGYILIDVREEAEWKCGHIQGAQLWPLSKLRQGYLPDVPQDSEIILHCQKGIRSLQAAQIFKDHGFIHVASLKGGYEAFIRAES